jgi:DNA uptake protein ComE-like DNA-binding protein
MKSQKWKDVMAFSSREKHGIVVLISVIVILVLIKALHPYYSNDKENFDFSDYESEIDRFEMSLSEQNKKDKSVKYVKKPDLNKSFSYTGSLFEFNPNTVQTEEMKSLGFSDALINNVTRYRKSGGKFYRKSDMKKMYSINDKFYSHIERYIVISSDNVSEIENVVFEFNPNNISRDSIVLLGFPEYIADRWIKYRAGGKDFSKIDDLKRIYGIDTILLNKLESEMLFVVGEKSITNTDDMPKAEVNINLCEKGELSENLNISLSIAGRIISYRNLLGGYVNKKQLLEVYSMDDFTYQKIEEYVFVDINEIKKLPINSCEYRDLLRHPYLNSQDVKAIMKYKEFKKEITDVRELMKNNLISEETFEKISPYFSLD